MIADVAEGKRDLRRRLRAARAARDDREQVAGRLLAAAIGAGLLDPDGQPGHVGPVRITAYVAAPGEPDVSAIRGSVQAAGGGVLLPIPQDARQLGWAPDEGQYVRAGILQVPMPDGPAIGFGAQFLVDWGVGVVLTPALAVDGAGTRLGQGGGFYDTLLATLPPGIAVVAVVHDEEVLEAGAIPRDPHDAAVTTVLTPSGLISLPG
jgi:5-formyltetrahydrofolate cyclo-ligase